METRKVSPIFKCIKALVRLFYPKMEVIGAENLPDEPSLIVGNHTQMNGPIACELYFPIKRYTWCAGPMMHLKEVPAYAYADFWSQKPKSVRWIFKILSYLIAPLSVCVFNNAQTVPVYRDARLRTTFRKTEECLEAGASVVIFPEHDVPYNNIICDFQDKFIDIAKIYHRKNGVELNFVPLYIAPNLHQMHIGKPIRFRADVPIAQERERIRQYLMTEITDIARALPRHTVVPYRNIPKKYYPVNILDEVSANEEACR